MSTICYKILAIENNTSSFRIVHLHVRIIAKYLLDTKVSNKKIILSQT
jgi:hypothetical protein